MENKNLKYMIITMIIILLILLIIAIIIILYNLSNDEINEDFQNYLSNDGENTILSLEENVYLIKNENLYFSIRNNIMQKYINCISKKDLQTVYNMLSKKYKTENNITMENVLSVLPMTYNISKVIPQHMYYKDGDLIDYVYVYTIIQNNEVTKDYGLNVTQTEEYYKIILDKEYETFAIEPINQDIYIQAVNNSYEEQDERVEKNEYNSMKYSNVTEEYVVNEYLEKFTNLLKYNPKKAYDLLDDEYKKFRFGEYSDFENYLKSVALDGNIVEKYIKKYKGDDVIRYICKDKYNNVYIFDETSTMEYTVQLDDYTLVNEEFNKEYENSDNKEKAKMNINKFFEMINMQDYKSAYAVLDESFKQNYFKTQGDFENYIKTNLYRYNTIKYKTYSNEISSMHIYTVTLTDSTGESEAEIELNIVIKLLEGTDFVMSFSKAE